MPPFAQTHAILLAAGAARQGVIGRAQLIDLGLPPSWVDHARRRGLLRPVFRSSYSVGRDVETTTAVWHAAILAAGPEAVLAGSSAAAAWGMLPPQNGLPRLVEVARPTRTLTMRAVSPALAGTTMVLRQHPLNNDEWVLVDGLPLTAPARTVIDLAGRFSFRQLRRVFLEGCRLGLIQKRDLLYLVQRSRSRPGAAKVRQVAALWVPGLEKTESILEATFLSSWAERDGRVPEVNEKLGPWMVDFLWRDERVVVETDGRAFHDHELARDRDARKDAWLERNGFLVFRFGYDDVNDGFGRIHRQVSGPLDSRRP